MWQKKNLANQDRSEDQDEQFSCLNELLKAKKLCQLWWKRCIASWFHHNSSRWRLQNGDGIHGKLRHIQNAPCWRWQDGGFLDLKSERCSCCKILSVCRHMPQMPRFHIVFLPPSPLSSSVCKCGIIRSRHLLWQTNALPPPQQKN